MAVDVVAVVDRVEGMAEETTVEEDVVAEVETKGEEVVVAKIIGITL